MELGRWWSRSLCWRGRRVRRFAFCAWERKGGNGLVSFDIWEGQGGLEEKERNREGEREERIHTVFQ